MEKGEWANNILISAIRNRQPIPEELLDTPTLMQGLELYYFAYFDLSSEKSTGFGVGRIPWTAKFKYAREYLELEGQDLDDFMYLINKLEMAHEDWSSSKREAKKK
mgnify:CR=1 FL=1